MLCFPFDISQEFQLRSVVCGRYIHYLREKKDRKKSGNLSVTLIGQKTQLNRVPVSSRAGCVSHMK